MTKFLAIGKGCRFCRGWKIAISHWLSQSPLTLGWRYRAARDAIYTCITTLLLIVDEIGKQINLYIYKGGINLIKFMPPQKTKSWVRVHAVCSNGDKHCAYWRFDMQWGVVGTRARVHWQALCTRMVQQGHVKYIFKWNSHVCAMRSIVTAPQHSTAI